MLRQLTIFGVLVVHGVVAAPFSPGDEDAIKTNIQVAFNVKMKDSSTTPVLENSFAFEEVITNIGNAYNTKTGIFTAPVDGLYLFSGTALNDGERNLSFSIMKNRVTIARPYSSIGKIISSGSDAAVVHLTKGDMVSTIYHGHGALDHMCRFSGVLLKVDHIAVAFNVKMKDSSTSPGLEKSFAFEEVITNIGNAYNPETGIFTAPVDGLYLFSGTALNDGERNLSFSIMKDRVTVARPYSSIGKIISSGSDTAVVHLAKGDMISTIYHGHGALDHMSRLSGVLLTVDP